MRAIDCPCGHRLEGADDQELFRRAREHVDNDHLEMQRSDAEELRTARCRRRRRLGGDHGE